MQIQATARRLLAAVFALAFGLSGASSASALTSPYAHDAAAYTYDTAASMSTTNATVEDTLGSPTEPRAVPWASHASVAQLGDAANTVATVGEASSTSYRATFLAANPGLGESVVVHHAVEQGVLTRYPGLFSEAEIHSLENLRGIPGGVNSSLHLSQIHRSWNSFYRSTPSPMRQDVLDHATQVDNLYGSQFLPPR